MKAAMVTLFTTIMVGAVASLMASAIIYLAWDAAVAGFGMPSISYWQALCLCFVCRTLFPASTCHTGAK